MVEDPFKRIDDDLRVDAGCTGEIDYAEQTSWLLFLKYLDSMEDQRKLSSEIQGKKYTHILQERYRWKAWAAPKKNGKIDYNKRVTGVDLINFVNEELFPYLREFKFLASNTDTIEYKIGEIFGEVKNKIQYGKTLANVIDIIDGFQFGSNSDKHEMSQLYEEKVKRMGNAGRNGGEYYTPRPLIRTMISIVNPKIGESIYDGAVGSAGFLCEAHDYLMSQPDLSTNDLEILQKKTFYGKEKKALAYVIGIMNMILHGINTPNIIHTNTLEENIFDIQDKDRHDIVLANPPFGGGERPEIQQNFPIRSGETAYLFLQHFIKILKNGGKGAIVIKNTFLRNDDASELRKELLSSCNLHTILDCPSGMFQGSPQKTVVLFFEKGQKTKNIWYYKLNPERNLGKTNPLTDDDLIEFKELQSEFRESPNSWNVKIEDVDTIKYDLSVNNPNAETVTLIRKPLEIIDFIEKSNQELEEKLGIVKDLFENKLSDTFLNNSSEWESIPFEDSIMKIKSTKKIKKRDFKEIGEYPIISQEMEFINGYWDDEEDLLTVESAVVVFGDHTMTLKYIDFDFVRGADGLKVLKPKEFILPKFFYYQLRSVKFESLGYARHYRLLKEIEIRYPDIETQKQIIEIFDKMEEQLSILSELYENKLNSVKELLQSMLTGVFCTDE